MPSGDELLVRKIHKTALRPQVCPQANKKRVDESRRRPTNFSRAVRETVGEQKKGARADESRRRRDCGRV